MAITRLKTWIKEVLTFSDLNAEFDNIINQARDLISPLTDSLDMNGKELILDEDGDSSIHASSDDIIDFKARSFDVLKVDGATGSSAVGLQIESVTTGNPVLVKSQGESDVGITFATTDDEEILKLTPVASAVNEVTITSAATGNNPIISCTGEADTGIDFENSEGEEILILDSVASSVNEITIASAATGNNPTIACTGEADTGITFQNSEGEEILILDSVATSVNEVKISSAATGNGPIITSSGETDVPLNINTAGTGNVIINGGATGTVDLGNAAISWPNSDGAAGNYVLVTDGAATASFASNVIGTGIATATVVPLPRSYLSGLGTSNGTDTAHDIDIAVGQCRDSTDACNMVVSTAIGKQIDQPAATGGTVGTPTGGFPTGLALADATWYHVLLISDGTNVTAGFDTSISGANLIADHSGGGGSDLSGYTYYRRIGSVLTYDSGGANYDITQYTQRHGMFIWASAVDTNPAAPDTTAQTATLSVPTGVYVEAIFNASMTSNAGSNRAVSLYSLDGDNTAPTTANGLISLVNPNTNDYAGGQYRIMTNTSAQIGYRSSANVSTFEIGVMGWVDNRGKDD